MMARKIESKFDRLNNLNLIFNSNYIKTNVENAERFQLLRPHTYSDRNEIWHRAIIWRYGSNDTSLSQFWDRAKNVDLSDR